MSLYHSYLDHPENYKFSFDRVMLNDTTRQVFDSYLKDTKNDEISMFLNETSKYKNFILGIYYDNKNNTDRRLVFLNEVNRIASTYINKGSKLQLNLDTKTVEAFELSLKKATTDSSGIDHATEHGRQALARIQYDIFLPIETHLYHTLKCDSFKRCLMSEKWRQFILSALKNESIFDKISDTIVPSSSNEAAYSMENILRPYISDIDFQFVREVCARSSFWKPFPRHKAMKEGVDIEIAPDKEFVLPYTDPNRDKPKGYQAELEEGLRRLKKPMKYVFTLNHHYETVLGCLTSDILTDNSDGFKYTLIDDNSMNKTGISSISFVMSVSMPMPLANREVPCLCSARRYMEDGNEAIAMIIRPYNDAHVSMVNSKAQRCRAMQAWKFVKLREHLTEVTVVVFMEFGGWFGASKLNSLTENSRNKHQTGLIIDYKNNIQNALTTMNKKDYPRPNDIGLLRSYESNLALDKLSPSFYQSRLIGNSELFNTHRYRQ